MYDITISDSTTTQQLPPTEVPLTVTTLEGSTDVQTLSYNIYTDYVTTKRVVTHTWSYMSQEDFELLKGFYDRQFTIFEYPEITIEGINVNSMTAKMSLEPRNIIDNCGTVQGVTVSWRETRQLGS